MTKQFLTFMISAYVFMTNPVLAMEEHKEGDPSGHLPVSKAVEDNKETLLKRLDKLKKKLEKEEASNKALREKGPIYTTIFIGGSPNPSLPLSLPNKDSHNAALGESFKKILEISDKLEQIRKALEPQSEDL